MAVIYAPAFVAVRHGYQAPDTLSGRYGHDRATAKRGLTTDHILPAMTDLVVDVNARALGDPRDPSPLDVLLDAGTVSATLDSAGYLRRLQTLNDLYYELGQLDVLFDLAVRWAKRKAWFAAAYAVALIPILARYGFGVSSIPDGVVLLDSGVSLVLATLAVVSWSQEANARNRLSELCEKYVG